MTSPLPTHARRRLAAMFAVAAVAVASLAAAPATTRPAAVVGRPFERLLALDDLTDDQRRAIERIAAETRDEAARATTPTTTPAAPRAIVERARLRALAVLKPAQRDRLRERRADDAPATTTRASAIPPPLEPPATSRPHALGVGDRLPNFSLARVDGKPVTFEQLVGKPIVLVFGSYSSPAFRDQLPRIADLATRYGTRAKVVVVYTREMFPTTQGIDQPERNQDAKIGVAVATSDADRLAAAKLLLDKLRVKLPVCVDAIDDRFTDAVDGFPNAAIVADAKGVVVERLAWAEPFAIKRALDRLLPTR